MQIIPVIASREAEIENGAFVAAHGGRPFRSSCSWSSGSAYSALRFRATDDDLDDGPPIHGHHGFQAVWLGTSFLLVLGLFVYGAVGLVEIRGAQTADFEVNVERRAVGVAFRVPGERASSRTSSTSRSTGASICRSSRMT